MIDIHNHLLYGVDDGSKSLEESIDVLKDMSKSGYEDIILTPHYIVDSSYQSKKDTNLERLNVLKEELKKNNIDINLYLGNEIYIDDDIETLLKNNKISSLNDSKYLLIELPMNGIYEEYESIFGSLIQKGYKVILAHPERYESFQKDYTKITDLKAIGVLFQCNLDSINGKYGEEAKNTIIRMLEDKLVSFIGTDIHRKKDEYAKWVVAKALMLEYIDPNYLEDLFLNNPKKIINNE